MTSRSNPFLLLLIFPVIIIASCGNSSPQSSRCLLASNAQMEAIRAGVKGIAQNNDIKTGYAVKSKDYKSVYFVAAKIYGPGMENGEGPGVWSISGTLDSPGMIYAIDGYAKNFSDYPAGDKTKANITSSDDGVSEAIACARASNSIP